VMKMTSNPDRPIAWCAVLIHLRNELRALREQVSDGRRPLSQRDLQGHARVIVYRSAFLCLSNDSSLYQLLSTSLRTGAFTKFNR
jgi:PHD/YefM family antitoxin component YafN of YafNO toxin-antitoxin module